MNNNTKNNIMNENKNNVQNNVDMSLKQIQVHKELFRLNHLFFKMGKT